MAKAIGHRWRSYAGDYLPPTPPYRKGGHGGDTDYRRERHLRRRSLGGQGREGSISVMQKLFCYVDETGQDASSEFFLVVAVVNDQDQQDFRDQLTAIEKHAKTGRRKWHKSRSQRRLDYLELILKKNIGKNNVFFGRYRKPLPYFLPVLETISGAIKEKADSPYQAMIIIDGIDRKKAAELTNALRLKGIKLNMVRGKRDETEPALRLADMWAGCICAALRKDMDAKNIYDHAMRSGYLIQLS